MFRTILYLLAAIVLITVLRLVIGMIMRGASQVLSGNPSSRPRAATPGGELKRDPVCGPYIAAATSFKQSVRGEIYHFCSRECSERFRS
jgi:YHS domain-containing protein